MHLSHRFSLLHRLLLIVLLAFCALSGLLTLHSLANSQQLRQAAADDLLNHAELQAARLQNLAARSDATLNSLMHRLSRLPEAPSQCSAILADFLRIEPSFAQIGKVTPQGDMVCTAVPVRQPLNFADRGWFQRAMASRHLVISHVDKGRVLGLPTLGFSKAQRNAAGQVEAVFYITIRMDGLERELLTLDGLPPGTRLWVRERQSQQVVCCKATGTLSQPLAAELTQALNTSHQGTLSTADGPQGVAQLVAYTPMFPTAASQPYDLILSRPVADVQAPLLHQLYLSLLLALGALVLLLGLAFWGGHRYLIQPLQRLALRARQLGTGELTSASLPLPAQDEFQELALAFDDMTTSLQERTVSRDRLQAEITEHERVALHLKLALKGAQAGTFEWDTTTGKAIWSNEVWPLLGLEEASHEPCYTTWQNVVQPEDWARVESLLQAAISRQEPFETEWRVWQPEAPNPRWLMCRCQPLPRSTPTAALRYAGVVMDITQHKAAELFQAQYRDLLEQSVAERTTHLSAARAEQHRLNRALRLLSDVNMALVRAHSEQELLDQVCQLAVDPGGYPLSWIGLREDTPDKTVRKAAAAGQQLHYMDKLQVSWNEAEAIGCGPVGLALRTGQTQVNRDSRTTPSVAPWLALALESGFHSSIALPLVYEDQVLGALSLYAKVTDAFTPSEIRLFEELAHNVTYGMLALRAREELTRYRQHLEELVAQRTLKIDQLNQSLTEKAAEADRANQAKGVFLATMSHEIRTPLNAVIGLAGLLHDTPLNPRQRDYLDKIRHSAQALRTLIDNILDFSKIEAGAMQLEQVPFSLHEVLQTVATILSVSVHHKPVEALLDVAPDVPDLLMGDSLRLQQILLNLISNAAKFTAQGLIVLEVRCAERLAHAATLELAVHDTGIGISEKHMGPIFEAFAQADSATARHYGGTGLGLSISARIADLMGGHICVRSTPGQGSTFRLGLTLALAPQPTDTRPAMSDLRVLVADDHPRVRAVLEHTCRAQGWTVDSVDSGPAALHQLQSGPACDVLLLDWHMLGMDGIEALRQAQALQPPDHPLPPVILLVPTFEVEQALATCGDLPLGGVVAKPVLPWRLREVIEQVRQGQRPDLPPTANMPSPATPSTDRRLLGRRLLVAEDNEINQQVIADILTHAGADIQLVANGQQAVDALRDPQAHFDAVLMDVQMPVMDGYTATHLIRHELQRHTLPIIALTAHAQADDAQRSRQAGMDGHIVKPIQVDALLTLLCAQPPQATPAAAAATTTAPQLDLRAALHAFGDNLEVYLRLLHKFIDQHGHDVQTALARLHAGDPAAAATLAHSLRGMGASLQLPQVTSLAGAAEDALRQDHAETASAPLEALATLMQTLPAAVAALEGSTAPGPHPDGA